MLKNPCTRIATIALMVALPLAATPIAVAETPHPLHRAACGNH